MKLDYPATQRNKMAIEEALHGLLPSTGRVLEVASGSGQHTAHFAQVWPALQWLPSSMEPQERASVDAWCADAPNVQPALNLDVLHPWPVDPGSIDVVYCANMIHIAPWACTPGLLAGAATALRPQGLLVMYGPFQVDGAHTAPSNEAFHASLQARNPDWGVRDRAVVAAEGRRVGLSLSHHLTLPANNQILVFRAGS
jgi:SAM-dependent methyltransferase